MTRTDLETVLRTADDWADPPDTTDDCPSETALVVPCSMSRCDRGASLWPVDPSRALVTVPTLGNQTWTAGERGKRLDENLAHLTTTDEVGAVVVIGHTACEIIADAYEQCVTPTPGAPAGIEARVRPLASLVESAIDEGVVDEATRVETALPRLVEYNVVRQVAFLRERLPASVTTVGYVFDQDGVYRSFPGKHYLVAVDGHTAASDIRARVPDDPSPPVARLLS